MRERGYREVSWVTPRRARVSNGAEILWRSALTGTVFLPLKGLSSGLLRAAAHHAASCRTQVARYQ